MVFDLKTLAVLIPLLPLIGTALVGAVGVRGLRSRSHWLVLAGVGLALVAAIYLFLDIRVQTGRQNGVGLDNLAEPLTIYQWLNAGPTSWLNVTFRIDPLTSVMLLTVLTVSFLIVAYSVGYMHDHHGHPERGYERFFAYMGLFVFSMCTLVLAGNFLLLYAGWELVGLCSYLLIGFHYQRPAAAAAAKKAFLVTRIGDFGFGLGILLIYLTFGTLDYRTVFDMVQHGATAVGGEALTEGRITLIALLLFCGAVGKSAQLPLYVWLPDAMEGPTPVSALIHAATMVTAGVYMVARCSVIFASSPDAMVVVACIGALTALFTATIALTQYDLKRILAYSTISQLGYMFLGLGVGAFDSAVFHLYTHAFFKALLFLAAGSVMHAMGGVIDIRKFGGLAKGMKITAATFWVGGLALAGCPLFAGFWSKDEIIHAALAGPFWPLGVIGLITALLTAFYTFRAIFMTFHGGLRLPAGVEHAHESGAWMAIPLILLAVGALLAGYVGVTPVRPQSVGFLGVFEPHGAFHEFLRPVFADARHCLQSAGAIPKAAGHEGGVPILMYASGLIAVWGIVTAWFFYRRRPTIPGAIALAYPALYQLLYHKYYVDEIYDAIFVRPLRRFGEFCHDIDRFFINGILWLIAAVPRAVGFGFKGWQQGSLQGYALAMVVGLLVILLWMLVRSAA